MIDAAAVARAVRTVPGVVDLHPGPHGTASTFAASGRVWGVRAGPDELHVHVVIDPTQHLPTMARRIRAAVRTLPGVGGIRIDVHAEDIMSPPERPEASPPGGPSIDTAVAWRGDTHPPTYLATSDQLRSST